MSFTIAAVATSDVGLLPGVGRRLGAAYFGIALLLFLGRSTPPSQLRSAVCISMLVALSLLAILGIVEFKAKRAGKGILVSVGVEVLLAAGFATALLAWFLATARAGRPKLSLRRTSQ